MSQPQGLRSLRLEKGWSQEQLATISGLSERTIQRAERGDTPSLETLGALAASFDLSSAQLRDLIQAPQETETMAANDTAPTETPTIANAQDDGASTALFNPVTKRLLLGGAIYLGVLTWLAVMQALAGWDPKLLPYVALTGGGLLGTYAFFQMGGDKEE